MEHRNDRRFPVYQYTTPSIVLRFGGLELRDVDTMRIKLVRGKVELLRTTARNGQVLLDLEENTATISLTQEESAAFPGGQATLQAHIKLKNGAVLATEQKAVIFDENLDREVM